MTYLTAFSDWLQTHSILITEAFRQILIVGSVFGWLVLTVEQQGVLLSAVSACLAIFTSKSNVSKANVDRIVERRITDKMDDSYTLPPAA